MITLRENVYKNLVIFSVSDLKKYILRNLVCKLDSFLIESLIEFFVELKLRDLLFSL